MREDQESPAKPADPRLDPSPADAAPSLYKPGARIWQSRPGSARERGPRFLSEAYGLAENPFGVTPDPRYLYESKTHLEAKSSLIVGIECAVGFQALIAPPGMGKTTLLCNILEEFDDVAHTAFLFQTQGNSRDFLRYLISELGGEAPDSDVVRMQETINELLIRERRAGRPTIVIIDEAQNLAPAVLETLRLLSNFETSTDKLLHIIFSGQPQLAKKLSSPEAAQLSQRICILTTLQAFGLEDTNNYIEHRLKVAGYQGPRLFSPEAVAAIWKRSGGIPREINKVCFNSLLLARATNKKRIDSPILREATSDLDLGRIQSRRPARLNEMLRHATVSEPRPANEVAESLATRIDRLCADPVPRPFIPPAQEAQGKSGDPVEDKSSETRVNVPPPAPETAQPEAAASSLAASPLMTAVAPDLDLQANAQGDTQEVDSTTAEAAQAAKSAPDPVEHASEGDLETREVSASVPDATSAKADVAEPLELAPAAPVDSVVDSVRDESEAGRDIGNVSESPRQAAVDVAEAALSSESGVDTSPQAVAEVEVVAQPSEQKDDSRSDAEIPSEPVELRIVECVEEAPKDDAKPVLEPGTTGDAGNSAEPPTEGDKSTGDAAGAVAATDADAIVEAEAKNEDNELSPKSAESDNPIVGADEAAPLEVGSDRIEEAVPVTELVSGAVSASDDDVAQTTVQNDDSIPESGVEEGTSEEADQFEETYPEHGTEENETSGADLLEPEDLDEDSSTAWLGRQWQAYRATVYLGLSGLLLVIAILWAPRSSSNSGTAGATPTPTGAITETSQPNPGPAEPVPPSDYHPQALVWLDVQNHSYYCPGSPLFGETQGGMFSTQQDAQEKHFQPANHEFCQ